MRGKIFGTNRDTIRHDQRSLKCIRQLANVAGPVVRVERGARLEPEAQRRPNVAARPLEDQVIDQPIEIMYTEAAVLIGIIAVNLPYMVLTLQGVLEGIARSTEEAAFSLGATPLVMARRILWPLAMPGILAGSILTFILAMNAYATPALLGGPKFQMMGTLVYGQFSQQNNWPFGGAISFILMSATLVLTSVSQMLIARRYHVS
jgi:ABC-type spermidine/putrescine transport system permease subunit I